MTIAEFKKVKTAHSKRVKKSDIPGSICLMPISIGQDYHQGDRGLATLKLLVRSGFAKIIIYLADTLQGHNIAALEGCTLEEGRERAAIKGDEWLEWLATQRSLDTDLAALNIEVIRWSDSLEQSHEQLTLVNSWSTQNYKNFQRLLNSTAAGFLRGTVGKVENIIDDTLVSTIFSSSVRYLKEEAAVALQWNSDLLQKYPDQTFFLAYPKEPNPIINFLLNTVDDTYKLCFEVLVIRFPTQSHKLTIGKKTDDRKSEGDTEEDSLSTDSEGSPPKPDFLGHLADIDAVKSELTMVREQLGEIPALREQITQLSQNLLFFYEAVIKGQNGSGSHHAPLMSFKVAVSLPTEQQNDHIQKAGLTKPIHLASTLTDFN